MADISAVEQAFVGTITGILYPQGPSQTSIVGSLCRVYRGWPNSSTLNADLNAGIVNVTVIADNDSGRLTTRYLPEFHSTTTAPGVEVMVVGTTIQISGQPFTGDVVGVIVDNKAYAYRIIAGDSCQVVAANLNLLIQMDHLTRLHDSSISIPAANNLTARVVSDASVVFESRRQEKDVRFICWCANPSIRDNVASLIDTGLEQIGFLRLPDGSDARSIYKNTVSYDQAQNALLYRRDLIYMVEYPTLTTLQQPSMLIGNSNTNGSITYG